MPKNWLTWRTGSGRCDEAFERGLRIGRGSILKSRGGQTCMLLIGLFVQLNVHARFKGVKLQFSVVQLTFVQKVHGL